MIDYTNAIKSFEMTSSSKHRTEDTETRKIQKHEKP